MVMFKDDIDSFCKYIVLRPPNIDRIVHQHREDRHLERSIRGIYYVARYHYQPAEGEPVTVQVDQFCGRLDPDEQNNLEAQATEIKIEEIDRWVHAAAAEAGVDVQKGSDRYTGEIMPSSA